MFVHGVNPLPLIVDSNKHDEFPKPDCLVAESDGGILGARRVKVQDL